MPQPLLLEFQDTEEFADLREDLSAAYYAGDGTLWLASDELQSLERLQWDGKKFTDHESFSLDRFFSLEEGKEIDIEGLIVADHYLWLVGSHSRKIPKPKEKKEEDKPKD